MPTSKKKIKVLQNQLLKEAQSSQNDMRHGNEQSRNLFQMFDEEIVKYVAQKGFKMSDIISESLLIPTHIKPEDKLEAYIRKRQSDLEDVVRFVRNKKKSKSQYCTDEDEDYAMYWTANSIQKRHISYVFKSIVLLSETLPDSCQAFDDILRLSGICRYVMAHWIREAKMKICESEGNNMGNENLNNNETPQNCMPEEPTPDRNHIGTSVKDLTVEKNAPTASGIVHEEKTVTRPVRSKYKRSQFDNISTYKTNKENVVDEIILASNSTKSKTIGTQPDKGEIVKDVQKVNVTPSKNQASPLATNKSPKVATEILSPNSAHSQASAKSDLTVGKNEPTTSSITQDIKKGKEKTVTRSVYSKYKRSTYKANNENIEDEIILASNSTNSKNTRTKPDKEDIVKEVQQVNLTPNKNQTPLATNKSPKLVEEILPSNSAHSLAPTKRVSVPAKSDDYDFYFYRKINKPQMSKSDLRKLGRKPWRQLVYLMCKSEQVSELKKKSHISENVQYSKTTKALRNTKRKNLEDIITMGPMKTKRLKKEKKIPKNSGDKIATGNNSPKAITTKQTNNRTVSARRSKKGNKLNDILSSLKGGRDSQLFLKPATVNKDDEKTPPSIRGKKGDTDRKKIPASGSFVGKSQKKAELERNAISRQLRSTRINVDTRTHLRVQLSPIPIDDGDDEKIYIKRKSLFPSKGNKKKPGPSTKKSKKK